MRYTHDKKLAEIFEDIAKNLDKVDGSTKKL